MLPCKHGREGVCAHGVARKAVSIVVPKTRLASPSRPCLSKCTSLVEKTNSSQVSMAVIVDWRRKPCERASSPKQRPRAAPLDTLRTLGVPSTTSCCRLPRTST